MVLAEEVFNPRAVDRAGRHIAEHDDRCGDLTQTEVFSRLCERVVGVLRSRGDLACQFTVSEHLGGKDFGGPIDPCRIEHGLVEDVIVSEECVRAAERLFVNSQSL